MMFISAQVDDNNNTNDSSANAAPRSSSSATNDNDINPLAQLNLPSPLLLGSASFTRKLILRQMNIPIHPLVRPIDEKALGDRSEFANPKELVLEVASAKMDHLVKEIRDGNCVDDMPTADVDGATTDEWILLTGDQVVLSQSTILEKPISIEQAKQFVSGYATSPCSTVGSCVLTHLPSGIRVAGVDTATIHFHSTMNGETLVDELLAEGAPILSCAGGLMIEHPLVQQYIDRIDGTEDSVMGLSKELVMRLLVELKEQLVEYTK
jgi:septum formation protein